MCVCVRYDYFHNGGLDALDLATIPVAQGLIYSLTVITITMVDLPLSSV
jgi:hypothetical protein